MAETSHRPRSLHPTGVSWDVVTYRNGNGVPCRRTEAMPHTSDDFLDQYAMGTLPESDMSVVEEHLLICAECQDRLKVTDAYIGAMRSAMKQHGKREAEDSDVLSSSRRSFTTIKR